MISEVLIGLDLPSMIKIECSGRRKIKCFEIESEILTHEYAFKQFSDTRECSNSVILLSSVSGVSNSATWIDGQKNLKLPSTILRKAIY